MLGSIIVVVVTASLLLTGVYLGNNQSKPENTEEVEPYDEGFFSSLNVLVGGLEESAERGEETKENRYQEYLKIKEDAEEASARFQQAPRTYKTQPATAPKVELKTAPSSTVNVTPTPSQNVPSTTTDDQDQNDSYTTYTSPSTPTPTPSGGEDLNLGDEDLFFDFDDFGDLDL